MVSKGLPVCRVCRRKVGDAHRVVVCGRTFSFAPMVCDVCAEARETKAEAQRKKPSRWERLCPPLYQCTDIRRLEKDLRLQGFDKRWIEEVLAWQYEPRGLVLNGPTGVGKSRVIWQLLRRLLDEEHRTGTALNAVTFRGSLQSAACERTTEEFVGRLVRTDVLYWDDLGQMHLTGPVSEMLLHLVEERACAGKPILVTTQYSGEELDTQFERPQMSAAIRRRLNEFCRVLTVREVGGQHECARFASENGMAVR
jgi:IstB-like ATP binding protein